MGDFFAVVFGGNQYCQYKLSDILANSFNGVVNEEYAFLGIRYRVPIIAEGNEYYMYGYMTGEEQKKEKITLKSGDYISISDQEIPMAILLMDYKECSLASKMYELKNGSSYFIGRSEEMNIVMHTSQSISRKQAVIRVDGSGTATIEDLSGKTGVYVNGVKVVSKCLEPGDLIFIMGSTFVYFNNGIIVPENLKTNCLTEKTELDSVFPGEEGNKFQYIRTPRIEKTLDDGVIEIDPPTPLQKQKDMPFILTAGPSLTMSLAMLASLAVTVSNALNGGGYTSIITSGVMALSMLLGALFWPKLIRDYNKKQAVKNEEHRQNRYRQYLEEKNKEIAHSYARNTRIWNESMYPNAQRLIEIVNARSRHLWERSAKDDDFLSVRLGAGERPFEVKIATRRRGFELEEDILNEEAGTIAKQYTELKDVPIILSLKEHKVVGVVGDYEELAKTIITNLVSMYAPDEVKIVLVYNRFQEIKFRKLNDLPHMWSSDKSMRYVATNETEAVAMFSAIDEMLHTREDSLGKDDIRIPHYVVLAFDHSIIESVPFRKTMVDKEQKLGLSALFFSEKFNYIPKECDVVIQNSNDVSGLYIRNENKNRLIKFKTDSVSDEDVNSLVEGLSKIEVKKEKTTLAVPERVSFLDIYRVGNVDDLNIQSHWSANASNRTLAAPIGIMAGGEPFYLDIHEKHHGCHGLVAGTTGSGKSEFLQAYILSMMINFSPNDVAFVLVDFKGGDMARPFLNSPHLAATISNLSGNTLHRALVSFEAEVKNRQRIFNEAAAKLGIDKIDINSYHKHYKERRLTEPLPHLVIVIDEFAQLKTQHPEFMAKLIDIAQVGRSLGIHLILATQKPSGVVDPQIWSNSRFKVCLKVMDKQDSTDMINRAVAAMIKLPGRAYVQVGYDEVFELIQSGYSGADYVPQNEYIDEESITVSMVNWPGEKIRQAKDLDKGVRTGFTQLEEIMKEMAKLGNKLQVKSKKLWLDPLPERLRFEELGHADDNSDRPGCVAIGRMDMPHKQQQSDYVLDFVTDGHLAIYGSAGTGKSTLIQTIFYAMGTKYTPDQFNAFVIDFNGESLIGLSKMPHCIDYVTGIDESKVNQVLRTIEQIIGERRAKFASASCANYKSYTDAGGTDMPIILVVIDNYASFREKMYKCEDILVQLIAAAHSCGIYFIVTGTSKGAIYYKVTDHISNKIMFSMNDTGSYRDIMNVPVPVMPENIKGRSLVIHEKLAVEMQVAVPFDAESEVIRMQKTVAAYKEMERQYGKAEQYDIPEEPKEQYEAEPEVQLYQRQAMKKLLSVDTEDAFELGTETGTGNSFGISLEKNSRIFVVNPKNKKEILTLFAERLSEKGRKVHIYSKERATESGEETVITDIDAFTWAYEASDDILIVDGFADLYDEISDEALDELIRVIKNHPEKQIITLDTMERIKDYCDTELYLLLVKCNAGIVLGGKADNDIAVLLNTDFYTMPEEYRKIELHDNQAIVYERDMAAYVQIGG